MVKKTFVMKGKVWLYPGETASWHFVNLPKKESQVIKEEFGQYSPGWGSLPVSVTIGETTWQTPIFPDKRSDNYLLPLKATVRQKEGIREGSMISFSVTVTPKGK